MFESLTKAGSSRAMRGALLVLLCGATACSSGATDDAAASPFDGGRDATAHDAATPQGDVGSGDAGSGDAGSGDAGSGDAGSGDAGVCSGQADGTPCGDSTSTECDAPDTCKQGACVSNRAVDGIACGDTTASTCSQPDTCQQGACVPNNAADGTACGDTTVSTCSQPDTCLSGTCAPNHAPAGTPCGGPAATECNGADACDGLGTCQPHVTADGTACYDCLEGGGLCGACMSGACPDAPQCTATPSAIATPIANNNGQDGNMFDVTATNTVVITGFEGNIANTPNATTEYWVFYKAGSHVGFENNSAAWTQLAGPLQITPNAPNTLTAILSGVSVVVPAGQTYAFYLTNTSASSNNNRYHNGTATGAALVSDENITIKEGTGGAYPFGTFFNARPWEGRVLYRSAIGTDASGAIASDGVMFDVSAATALSVNRLDVHLAAGTHALEVYFRRGTHVGAETNPALWHLLDAQPGVVSSSSSKLTRVPFSTDIRLDAGERGALYVTTGAGSSGVLSRAGTAVGTAVVTNARATLHEGVAVSGSFGAVGATSVGEALVGYDVCGP